MTRVFTRWLALAVLGAGLVPVVAGACHRWSAAVAGGGLLLALWVAAGARALLTNLYPHIDASARAQAAYLDKLPAARTGLTIVGAAALSLFFELALIRWQSAAFPFFALYKNFSLLSCFVGLGLGYALAGRDRVLLACSIPVLAGQVALLTGLRFGLGSAGSCLTIVPFREQLSMGLGGPPGVWPTITVYFFLSVVFLFTVLAFVPIGQLCGRMMERREKLVAYGLNLLGSLAGVGLMLLVSWWWTPPLVWFAIGLLGTLSFYPRAGGGLRVGVAFATATLIVLAWPADLRWQRIYSPYQVVELAQGRRGLLQLRAAGFYYQQVQDLARTNRNVEIDLELRRIRDYYELPYQVFGPARDVAIVGAGLGNDVAAALRTGARRVDAIEIDPAILKAGTVAHPEHPYQDPRVHAYVDDARSFLRRTSRTYDLVIYGLLDSHTLLSHASTVRLDSFVYTVEALREARARLNPGGMLALSFAVMNDRLARKIYLMLERAFDGHAPVSIAAGYDSSVTFLEARDGDLALPPRVLEARGFENRTSYYANPALQADVSTDDWPFLYMPRRVYPVSFLPMAGLLLALAALVTASLVPERPRSDHAPFLFLGAGFMLVETKGITELGLVFGNSWQVIGVVISGILAMAFLANYAVLRLGMRRPLVGYVLLLASLAVGWWQSGGGGFASTPLGRAEAALVLTCPLFFSGIVFSTLLKSRGALAGIMALNLLGALGGGLLEYNAMYFGFRALYVLAAALYGLALGWDGVFRAMSVQATRPRSERDILGPGSS